MTQTSTGADETSTADRLRGAGSHVAGTAADEAANVTQEVKHQAKNLLGDVRSQLSEQVSNQKDRAADGIRSVSDELRSMADSSSSHGVASNLVSQAATRAGDVAGWLEGKDPSAVLDDVKRFARRRPGVFIAIAAGAGIVVGRLVKSLSGGEDSSQGTSPSRTDMTGADPSEGPIAGTSANYTGEYTQSSGYAEPEAYADAADYAPPVPPTSTDSGDLR